MTVPIQDGLSSSQVLPSQNDYKISIDSLTIRASMRQLGNSSVESTAIRKVLFVPVLSSTVTRSEASGRLRPRVAVVF